MPVLALIGLLAALVGWVWLVIVAFKTNGALWGILNIFFQPITGLIFCIMKKTGWTPFIVMIVGLVVFYGFAGITMITSR